MNTSKKIASLWVVALLFLAGCGNTPAPPSASPIATAPATAETSGQTADTAGRVATPAADTPQAPPEATPSTGAETGGTAIPVDSGAASGAPPPGNLDGCALLRKAGIETLFGKPIKEPGPPKFKASITIASCDWKFDAGAGSDFPGYVGLLVYAPPPAVDPGDPTPLVVYNQTRGLIVALVKRTDAEATAYAAVEGGTDRLDEPVPGFGSPSIRLVAPKHIDFAVLTSRGLVVYVHTMKVNNADNMSMLVKSVIDQLSK